MAQSGYTTIQLYYSPTATNAPIAANMASGELAINIVDGKLYYKDNAGTIQLIASKAGSSGLFTNITVTGTATIATLVASAGSIDNTTIGATTPSTGAFTTVTTPIVNSATTLALETGGVAALTFDAAQNGTFNSTGAVTVPVGTAAQEPVGAVAGALRFNTSTTQFEGYNGSIWGGIGGAQAGGAIITNNQDATVSYTITPTQNGFSVGPVTVDPGVVITVSSGSRWAII